MPDLTVKSIDDMEAIYWWGCGMQRRHLDHVVEAAAAGELRHFVARAPSRGG
jgi:hypothetical protein